MNILQYNKIMDIDIKINIILSRFMSFIKIYLIRFKFRLLNLIVQKISRTYKLQQ